jgi:D-sedoheptulose 7-phosphate isomerase
MKNIIKNHFLEIKKILNNSNDIVNKVEKISIFLKRKIKKKNKIFVYGNGGSFADASHFVGELTATYSSKKRKPLPFILLGSNQAAISGWSNDFNFDDYIVREFSSYVSKNDVLFLFSTSGGNIKRKQSINLIKLAKYAKSKKIPIISLLGKGGGELKKISSEYILIDSYKTGSIQEAHKIIFHSLCETFENFK